MSKVHAEGFQELQLYEEYRKIQVFNLGESKKSKAMGNKHLLAN